MYKGEKVCVGSTVWLVVFRKDWAYFRESNQVWVSGLPVVFGENLTSLKRLLYIHLGRIILLIC